MEKTFINTSLSNILPLCFVVLTFVVCPARSSILCVDLFEKPTQTEQALRRQSGGVASESILPHSKKSIWLKLAEILHIERIAFFRNFIEEHLTKKFTLLGPSEIPEGARESFPNYFYVGNSLVELGRAFDYSQAPEINKLIPPVNSRVGEVELSNVFVTLNQFDLIKKPSLRNTIRSPIVLGKLVNSDQPVLVFIMGSEYNSTDLPSINHAQSAFVQAASYLSDLGLGLSFYGARQIDAKGRVVGLVFDAPGPLVSTRTLAERQALTSDHMKQIIAIHEKLDSYLPNSVLAIEFYVNQHGKVIAVPKLGASRDSMAAYRAIQDLEISAKTHGLVVDQNRAVKSVKKIKIAREMMGLLQTMAKMNTSQLTSFFDWLHENRSYIFREMIILSFEEIARADERYDFEQWAKVLHQWAQQRRINILSKARPDLPTLALTDLEATRVGGRQKIVQIKTLQIGDAVLLKTSDLYEHDWKRDSELSAGTQASAVFEKVIVMADKQLGYVFKITNRSDTGETQQSITLSDQELMALSAVIGPRDVLETMVSVRRMNREVDARLSVKNPIEDLGEVVNLAELAKVARENSMQNQRSPFAITSGYENGNFNIRKNRLPDHPIAKAEFAKYGSLNETSRYYHTKSRSQFISIAREGSKDSGKNVVRIFRSDAMTKPEVEFKIENAGSGSGIVWVGEKYFATFERFEGRDQSVVRDITNGKPIFAHSSDGFVGIAASINEKVIYVAALGFTIAFVMPKGASQYHREETLNASELKMVKDVWDSQMALLHQSGSGHSQYISHFLVSDDGRYQITALKGGYYGNATFGVYDTASGKIFGPINSGVSEIKFLDITPDHKVVITGEDKKQKVFQLSPVR